MKHKALHCIDFYKSDHRRQYPDGTQYVYSNLTPRSGKYSLAQGKGVVMFDLQGFMKWFLQDLWNETFFEMPFNEIYRQYKRRLDNGLGKDAVPIEHIEQLHNLGYLPIRIKALPEGSFVPYGVPCITIVNTRPQFFWLTNYLESVMSAELWKGMTSATTALAYRQRFEEHADLTGVPKDFVPFQGHDFSFRGMGGISDAAVSGAGHLCVFYGTDTIPAIDYLEDYYGANSDEEIVGVSVPATEHSVMCMGGNEDEQGTFERLITELYPAGIVSIVSDTWDLWKVLTEYLPNLKEQVMAREGRVVIRPDSGDPVDIICGTNTGFEIEYKIKNKFKKNVTDSDVVEHLKEYYSGDLFDVWYDCGVNSSDACDYEAVVAYASYHDDVYKVTLVPTSVNKAPEWDAKWNVDDADITVEKLVETPESKGVYELLWDTFGGTVNEQGYKVLDTHVGAIYGDSITLERQDQILKRLEAKGFCASNLVLGIGSYTYQYVTRDTHGFAMKATWGAVNGEGREIFKDPITDDGVKKSAKGLLIVNKDKDGNYKLTDQVLSDHEENGCLGEVFFNGKITKEFTLAEIRANVNSLM